jgi:hypothetical protein
MNEETIPDPDLPKVNVYLSRRYQWIPEACLPYLNAETRSQVPELLCMLF